ncbi:hypothetical protein [Bradyrhizobium sp. Ce-3]|uniref:hypothetical protein n=1 Tax=Bradyrhizobium sp. Ce-3 TaxID=2913970 RepID=UPI001FC84901|nr:hypothetical protein [Bradyrhizobium sp. Ce-3]GKQ55409.1 hypothetical protein BRSPCE3_62640 [Bradyrhizobium sp. Ce-3]
MSPSSKHGSPVLYRVGQPITALRNFKLGEPGREDGHREEFLQRLVHERPDVIPMEEIEPAFRPLIAVCTELVTQAGSIDNVWITPQGGLIIGECKLIRNPQSRREVVAQVFDYARAVTGWHYEDLERAVRKARKEPSFSLWGLVKDHTDLDEQRFVDAVTRRLRSGRFMLLVISDGIHEGVEALAGYLQLHAGVHAGLALLDLSLWEGIDGGILVVPRIPLRTVLIERGIVVTEGTNTRIDPPSTAGSAGSDTPRHVTASEPEFYAQLEQYQPGQTEKLRAFLASLKPLGIEPEFARSLFLRWQGTNDITLSAGTIEPTGSIWLLKAVSDARLAGNEPAALNYLEAVARLAGGSVKRYDTGSIDVRGADGRSLRISALTDHAAEWKDAIGNFIKEIS